MSDPAENKLASPIDLNGLEVLFEENLEVSQEGVEEIQEEALPIAKAASLLGVHRRYALDLLHKGKLQGFKDPKGQWFVNLNSINSRLEGATSNLQEVSLETSRSGVEVNLEPLQEHSVDDPRDKIIQDLQSKVEAASYRIGYLQHQIESQQEQIKLLTDSQHKASWWGRLKTWASGV
jgi:hypothetical protein